MPLHWSRALEKLRKTLDQRGGHFVPKKSPGILCRQIATKWVRGGGRASFFSARTAEKARPDKLLIFFWRGHDTVQILFFGLVLFMGSWYCGNKNYRLELLRMLNFSPTKAVLARPELMNLLRVSRKWIYGSVYWW